jgi:tellurite resistance-related uncharacterized protein
MTRSERFQALTYSESILMPDELPDRPNPSQLRERALSRWDNEGGAGPDGPQEGGASVPAPLADPVPYKSTPVFDENTLPAGLRREHRTKAGVWGVIRMLEGRLRYQMVDQASEEILDPDHPGLVLPNVPHLVEPLGPMRMQIDFYNQPPRL